MALLSLFIENIYFVGQLWDICLMFCDGESNSEN